MTEKQTPLLLTFGKGGIFDARVSMNYAVTARSAFFMHTLRSALITFCTQLQGNWLSEVLVEGDK